MALNKKCFIFLTYKKLEKKTGCCAESPIKKKMSSLIAACSFLYAHFLFAGTYCTRAVLAALSVSVLFFFIKSSVSPQLSFFFTSSDIEEAAYKSSVSLLVSFCYSFSQRACFYSTVVLLYQF